MTAHINTPAIDTPSPCRHPLIMSNFSESPAPASPPRKGDGSCAAQVETPIGRLTVTEQDGAITSLLWNRDGNAGAALQETPLLREALDQLSAYFDRRLTRFDLPLKLSSSPFERQVQQAMIAIPHGETLTYGDIARELGSYGQPVGQACGKNAIPIIVPCHRVLSAQGLGGFSGEGGVEMKIHLLKHEGGYPFLV